MNENGLEIPLCIPMTEENAKKMLTFHNKLLKNSQSLYAQKLGDYGRENLDEIAKNFVKKRCEEVLEDEGNGQDTP